MQLFSVVFALDSQEPDELAVAQCMTMQGELVGLVGDKVREPPLRQLCIASPALAAGQYLHMIPRAGLRRDCKEQVWRVPSTKELPQPHRRGEAGGQGGGTGDYRSGGEGRGGQEAGVPEEGRSQAEAPEEGGLRQGSGFGTGQGKCACELCRALTTPCSVAAPLYV